MPAGGGVKSEKVKRRTNIATGTYSDIFTLTLDPWPALDRRMRRLGGMTHTIFRVMLGWTSFFTSMVGVFFARPRRPSLPLWWRGRVIGGQEGLGRIGGVAHRTQ